MQKSINHKQNTFADRAAAVGQVLSNQLDTESRGLLGQFPVDVYCQHLKNYPPVGTYKVMHKDLENRYLEIIEKNDETILELFHKLAVVTLLIESSDRIETHNFPQKIVDLYWINFESILEKIKNDSLPKGAYLFPQDRLFKDLGICTLKLIPAGVRKIHLEQVPIKRFLFKGGFKQLIKGLACILFELKGIQPVFHGHLDSRDRQAMAEFSLEGWIRHYKMVADLLKIQTNVKGVMGLAWFYDPRLRDISPNLTYLREIVVDNGGHLFFEGVHESAIKNATLLSRKRKILYEEGKYIPTNYLYLWPRSKIIQWAERV